MLLKWLSLLDPVNQITTWPDSILENIPTQSENQLISALLEDLKCFQSVSKKLQTGGPLQMNIYDSEVLLDGLLGDFGVKYPLTSSIINDQDFENGIAKI